MVKSNKIGGLPGEVAIGQMVIKYCFFAYFVHTIDDLVLIQIA